MWEYLPDEKKLYYKRLILAFTSLSELFNQKNVDDDHDIAPFINSKYQETVFQKAFNATPEDIGNTSFDASVKFNNERFLVGIKTFGIKSGDQKISQFKGKHDEWSEIIDQIEKNAKGKQTKKEIDKVNKNLYLELAKKIAKLRNDKIDSDVANLKGFEATLNDVHVHPIYHVLMPSDKNSVPKIFVGETSYDKINIEDIDEIGCTGKDHPTNFVFSDGKHNYKYTSADSQLYMKFNNSEIVCEEWDVKYVENAISLMENIYSGVFDYSTQKLPFVAEPSLKYITSSKKSKEPCETYCWTIWNKKREVEMFSGFNSFYGVGSKKKKIDREKAIIQFEKKYTNVVSEDLLQQIIDGLTVFLTQNANSQAEKIERSRLRTDLIKLSELADNKQFVNDIIALLYRPVDEVYIPIPDAKKFHEEHPDFFGKGYGKLKPGTSTLKLDKSDRVFNLVFEPSGNSIQAFIAEDNGKAIESFKKQSYLGKWILREIFKLEEREPLTSSKLIDLEKNGVRLSKYKGSNDIHLEFIWIDEDNPPKGYIERKR